MTAKFWSKPQQLSKQLKEIKSLSNGTIKVKVEDHSRLNTCKGVIYCRDFEYCSDEKITENVKNQNILMVWRITRKVNSIVKPTHLFVVTFDSPTLPTEFKAAYPNISVRPFIPQPLRCYKCQHFGHFTMRCPSSTHICDVCSEIVTDPTLKEKCEKPAKCVNCNEAIPFFSKKCEKYILRTTFILSNWNFLSLCVVYNDLIIWHW